MFNQIDSPRHCKIYTKIVKKDMVALEYLADSVENSITTKNAVKHLLLLYGDG